MQINIMLKPTLLLLLSICICQWKATNAETQLTNVVQLKAGQIRGSLLDVYHHKVEFYQAIKYGKPENASVFAKLNSTFVLLFFL